MQTNLVTTCARKEVDVIHLQWFHAQRALKYEYKL